MANGGLAAHYTFDNNADLGADSSGNGYNMNFGGGWNGGGSGGTNQAIAGAGAASFYRNPGNANSGGFMGWNPMPTNLLMVLAGDFTLSLWLNTTDNYGNRSDFAFNGAGIVSADVYGIASDLMPLALTGGQAAFNTGNTNGGYDDDTLNSAATVNHGPS